MMFAEITTVLIENTVKDLCLEHGYLSANCLEDQGIRRKVRLIADGAVFDAQSTTGTLVKVHAACLLSDPDPELPCLALNHLYLGISQQLDIGMPGHVHHSGVIIQASSQG